MRTAPKLMSLAAAISLFASGALAQDTASEARGEFSTPESASVLEYDPSANCHKPRRPITENDSVWTTYRNDARRYVDCVEEAARADVDYVQDVVQQGYEAAVQEFMEELNRGS